MQNNDVNADNLMVIASQFDECFSIDWVLELAGIKATIGLKEMDGAVQAGILKQTEPGVYRFIDQNQRRRYKATIPDHQSEDLQSRIIDLYLRETPDENAFTEQITAYLINIDNDTEGCHWLLRAGLFYKKTFQRDAARRCFAKIINDIEKIQSEEADRLYVSAAVEYSKSVDNSDHVPSAYPILKNALKRAEKLNDSVGLANIEIHLSNVQWFRGQHTRSYRHYERACTLSRAIKDPNWQRSFTIFKIIESTVWGRYLDALVDHQKFTPDVAKYPRYWHSFRGAIYLGVSLAYTGNIAQGLGLVHSIRNHCRKMGNLSIACEAGVQMVNVLIDIRNIDKAVACIHENMHEAIALKNDLLRKSLLRQLAYCHYLKGDYDHSVETLIEIHDLEDNDLSHQPSYPFSLELAWAMEQNKFPRLDHFDLNQIIERHTQVLNVDVKGIAFRYKALVEAKEGASSKSVLRSFLKSQQLLEEAGHKTELARTRLAIQRYHSDTGNRKKAQSMEVRAREVVDDMDSDLIPADLNILRITPPNEKAILKEILELSRDIASIRNAKELLQQIISTANRITGAERGAIFLLNPQKKKADLRLRASRTLTDQDVKDAAFKGSMDLVNQTAATGKGCVKVFEDSHVEGTLMGNRIKACVCVPMIIRDQVVGVMYHDNSLLASSFSKVDMELLSHFAALAAIAIDNAQVYAEVKRLNKSLREEKEYYKEKDLENVHFDEIVGKSQAIAQVLSNVRQVAETDATVLILGETGVGKELVARAVHAQSGRKNGPFIRVHCSALPESLISSELFGHEKGAFTGAGKRRIGRFELADGGTLFLDEIGELPMEIQVHLLRVLQTGEFERVGGSETLKSDFRLVLATNRDLEREVREGRFRQDLYYRINVFPITVPPLRERKEDIPLLASYFLNMYGSRLNKPLDKIRRKDVEMLMGYDWPGNVRELENVIERGMILSAGPELVVPELQSSSASMAVYDVENLPTITENERNLIFAALVRTKGKIQGEGGAAELLDINPHTLKSRMKKLGIKREHAIT